jgi:23S rRNA pseudouridine2604 synthase
MPPFAPPNSSKNLNSREYTRINKFLTQANYCSRRQADRLIENKKVYLNNRLAVLGDKVSENDSVVIEGKCIRVLSAKKIYLAYHKPVGVICTTDPHSPNNIIDAVHYHTRVYPIGRLDVNTSGLILLTNDGSIVNHILKAQNKVEKEYVVEVDKPIRPEFLLGIQHGITLEGYKTLPAHAKKISERAFSMILCEGKNRQVRKMCAAFGYTVLKLARVRIGSITIEGLSYGKYRAIPESTVKKLFA